MPRVATVSADLDTIRFLGWKGDGVVRLPAPPDHRWVESNSADFDLMHLESWPGIATRSSVDDLLASLEDARKPLVYTFASDNHQSAIRETLVPAANRILVNSHQAEGELLRSYGRQGTYLPHSHVLTPEEMGELPPGRRIPPFTLGMALPDLSPHPTAEAIVEVMAQVARESSCFRARIDVESDSFRPERDPGSLSPLLTGLARRNQIDLRLNDRLGRSRIRDFATAVDIAVFPSWLGPQSGWIEACRDAGTAIVAPDGPDLDSLRPSFGYRVFPTGAPNRRDLEAAFEKAQQALTAGRMEPVGADRRRHHRRTVAGLYSEIFDQVLTGESIAPVPGPRASGQKLVA